MAMYECAHCGSEEGAFPKVFLSINDIPEYPDNPHENKFEQKFEELYKDLTGKDPQYYVSENWKNFWSWLGNTETKWFCSVECAVMYLRERKEKND